MKNRVRLFVYEIESPNIYMPWTKIEPRVQLDLYFRLFAGHKRCKSDSDGCKVMDGIEIIKAQLMVAVPIYQIIVLQIFETR